MNILTRIGIALGHWLLRACGHTPVGQAAGPVSPVARAPVPAVLNLTRDHRGRFCSLTKPDPPPYPFEPLGVTPKMFAEATPLVIPDGVHLNDVDSMALVIRGWALHNLDHWVHGCHRNPLTALRVLENTWALDRLRHAAALVAAEAQLKSCAALPKRTEVRGNTWIAYPPPPIQPTIRSGTSSGVDDGFKLQASSFLVRQNVAAQQAAPSGEPGSLKLEAGSFLPEGDNLSEPTAPQQTLKVPRYNPELDVIARLPKALKRAQCEGGCDQGFGNTPQLAVDNYYDRNRRRLGGSWAMFGLPCRTFEAFDGAGRKYYVARANFSLKDRMLDEEWALRSVEWTERDAQADDAPSAQPGELGSPTAPDQANAPAGSAELGATLTCAQPGELSSPTAPGQATREAPATSQSLEQHWVGAGPVPARGGQSSGDICHQEIENTKQDEQSQSSHLSHPARCLGGEEKIPASTEPNRAASTTAGGRKVLPYAMGNTSCAAATPEPEPLNPEPSSRPPPNYLQLLDAP